MPVLGIDVGVDQGTLGLGAWQKIRSENIVFAFLRCMEGLDPVDSTYAGNVTSALSAGIVVGAYFVLHPWLDVASQVRAWFAAAKGIGASYRDLAPVIDIELDHDGARAMTPAQILAALILCAKTMDAAWGRPPTIYTYPDFEKRDILGGGDATPLAAYPLWLAAYQASPPAKAPLPWATITFWQESGGNKYRTPIGTPCDQDVFLGDEAAFAAFLAPPRPIPNPLAGIPVPGIDPDAERDA
jgi:GH25 family lysozyme M1 (1,4-beta-N-acetylmuramidase)